MSKLPRKIPPVKPDPYAIYRPAETLLRQLIRKELAKQKGVRHA